MEEWAVYILFSEKDKRRYIGSINNLERRLQQHFSGKVFSTKSRLPLRLIYQGKFFSEKEARAKEHFLKTHKGYIELKKLIKKNGV